MVAFSTWHVYKGCTSIKVNNVYLCMYSNINLRFNLTSGSDKMMHKLTVSIYGRSACGLYRITLRGMRQFDCFNLYLIIYYLRELVLNTWDGITWIINFTNSNGVFEFLNRGLINLIILSFHSTWNIHTWRYPEWLQWVVLDIISIWKTKENLIKICVELNQRITYRIKTFNR